MKLHLPKMLFAAVLACFSMVQAATMSSISEKTPITINLNFDSGRGAVPANTTKITVAGVTTTGDQWINLTGANGTDIAVTDTAGKTYKLTFTSAGTWAASGTADALNINKGYLDMANWAGGKGISITLTNEDGTAIAWNQVNILMTGDGGNYGGINVNGTNYCYTGTTLKEGGDAWGSRTGIATYTEGTNLMVLKPGSVASADGLVLTTTGGGAARATMGGLQVVTGYGESQVTAYKISDFSEGETASLAALAAGADLTKVPLTIEVTATAAADDVAMLGLDAATGEVIVKGGALGMDVTTDTTVGTIALEDGGSIGALNIAEGKTLTVTGPQDTLVAATTSGTGKLVIGMVNNKEASGKGVLNFGDSCEFESVRVTSGVLATNLNGAALSANIGSADLIMAGGTTYVIRNGNGTNASITSGDIVLEGAMDLQVYGSTHDSVISNNIIESSEDASTYIRKTDGGTTTLTGEVTVDSVRVAAGTLVLGDGNVTTTGQIRLSENGSNGNKLVIAKGAVLNVTGSVNDHGTSDSIVLAHWGQTGFLEVNGGTLNAEGAVALVSWTGTGTLSVLSGTAKLKGLDFWGQSYSGTEFKGVFNLGTAEDGDGVLELGDSGIYNVGSAGGGTATLNLGNGTIRAMADTQITRNTGFSSGVVNLIGTNGGTVFDTNGHDFSTVNLGMEGDGDLVKIGEGTLTTGRITTTGQIKIDEGTWVVDGNTTISQTIINNGTIQGGIGKIVVDSLDGFEGEAGYNDKLAPDSGNGYMSSADFIVIKAEEGKTSTLVDLTQISFGGMDLDLVTTDTQSSVSVQTSGDAGAYFINKGVVDYGADDNSAYSDATTALVVNGGDLTLSKALKDNIPQIQIQKDTTLTINEGVSLGKGQIAGDGTVTLAGGGSFGIGAATALPAGVTIGSDWTGTVVVDGIRFAGDDGKLANLANSNSFVGLTNCTGWLTPGGTVSGNLNLLKGDALCLTDGSNGRIQTFSSKIIGDGNIVIDMQPKANNQGVLSNSTVNNVSYVFSGDVSGWTGAFVTHHTAPNPDKTFNVSLTGAGDIGASINNAKEFVLNVTIGGAGDRTMNGDITNAGTLNLTVNGAGHKTFTKDITATMLTVASGTGVTLEGTTEVGQLAASGTITNKGAFSISGGLNGTISTTGLDIAADKSSLVQADGVTASTDGNGFMTGGFYYVVHSTDGGTLAIDDALVTGNYKLDGNDILYTAAGDDTTYYINNSIAFTGSDAANVAAGKTIQVMSGAVLSLESTGVDAGVTLATKGAGTVLLIGSGDWNCENSLGADKKQIGNLQTDAGVNAVVSFATMDAFKNAGTNITLADDSLLKVSVAAGQTKSMSAFNNVKGGTIVIDPNSGTGNLSLDPGNACTYSGSIEFVLSQFVIVDTNNGKQMFQADANGKYADITVTAKTSGKALIINPNYWNKSQAWNIGCLSGNGEINGKNKDNPADHLGRYIAVHQDKDTTFSGLFVDSGVSGGKPNRSVGILKYGEGTLTLTGANGSLADLDIHEGTIALKDAGKWAGAVLIDNGATLDMSAATTKSLTKLTVNGGATLNAGGASVAVGSLVLEGVSGSHLLTIAGLDTSAKSVDLFTGLTGDTAVSGIEFETMFGQQVAKASNYIAGVGEGSYLLLNGGTLSLVDHISSDFYWHGADGTWDGTGVDWTREADETTANSAYVDGVTAHFVGATGTITVEGERSAQGVEVKDCSTLSIAATGDGNSLTIGQQGLTISNSALTLGGNVTVEGDVTMGDAASLKVTDSLTIGDLGFSGATISHTGTDEAVSALSASFTTTGGTVSTGDTTMRMKLDGVALDHTGSGMLAIQTGATLTSLTSAGTVYVDGTTTIGTDTVGDQATVTTGGEAFNLGSGKTTVTNGSVTTNASGISAVLSNVALTTTADTIITGEQTLTSLTTGSNAATLADTTIGGTSLSGSTVTTGTDAFDLASATTTVTNGTVTTDATTINATLTGVALTTTGAATINGKQSLTNLTPGGALTINGDVTAGDKTTVGTVHGDATLAGNGEFVTTGALSLAGASSIGSLTADSLSLVDGATLAASKLSLTSTEVAVAGLTGIGASNHLLDVTGTAPTELGFAIDLSSLQKATFDEHNKLEIASIAGLTSATFAGGDAYVTDKESLRRYTIGTDDGLVTITVKTTGNEWLDTDGTWSGDEGEFELAPVTKTENALFLGEGASTVTVSEAKEAAKLIVDVQPDTPNVDKGYTFTGDSITADSFQVNRGSLTVENSITAGETSVGAGSLTIAEGGSVNGGKTSGSITNNGTLTIGNGSDVTLDGTGKLISSGATSVTADSLASVDNKGTLTLTKDTEIAALDNSGTVDAGTGTVTLTGTSTGSGELKAGTVDVKGSGHEVGTLTAGSLVLESSALSTDAALLTAGAVSRNTDVTISGLDAASALAMAEGDYKIVSTENGANLNVTGQDTLTQDVAVQENKAVLVLANADGLTLKVADDSDRTWHTDKTYTYLNDATDDESMRVLNVNSLLADPKTAYRALDTIQHVVVDSGSETFIYLDQADLGAKGEDGLIINNLTGTEGSTLSIVGFDENNKGLVTLRTTEDCVGGETLNLEKVTVKVDNQNGTTLTVGELTGNGVLDGNIKVTRGSSFTGSYANADVDMVSGEQTLAAGSGLTVSGTGGAAILDIAQGGSSITAINTNGATVQLGAAPEGGTLTSTETLTLESASSMTGGQLVLAISAADVQSTLSSGDLHTATTGATLTLNGVEVVVYVTDTDKVTELTTSTTDPTITLFQISDAADSSATGCSLTLNNGDLLKKYFSNIRLVNGSIDVVGDRQTDYYSQQFGNLSENGNAGLDLASKALSFLDPQNNKDVAPDLAKVLTSLDDAAGAVDAAAKADRIASALAGASTAILGAAQSADVDRQLRAIRNRVVNMGSVSECIDLSDQPRSHVWINAEGDYNKLDKDGTAAGYTLNSWGGTVGFDYDFSTRFTAGVALTAMYGKLNAAGPERNAEGDLDNYYLTMFARYASKSWVNMFVLTMGRADASFDRTDDAFSTSGSTDGLSFGALYELAYTIPVGEDGNACWQPVFNVALKHTTMNAYTEEGSDAALDVGRQTMTSATLGLGARGQMVVGETTYNRASVLELRALAKLEAGDRYSEADVSLPIVGAHGVTRSVKSAERGAFGVEIGAGLVVPVGVESGALFFDASAEFRGGTTNFNGVVGYRLTF